MKENDTNKQIGAWLAMKRKEKNLSQQNVADMLGVSKVAVHLWETGKRTIFAIHFINYCKAIGADPTECIQEIMQ